MKKLKSPIPYFGGKHFLRNHIISRFPTHKTYVEVFGGSATVLLGKKPSPVEVYNDLDQAVVNFFRVLRDEKKNEKLRRKLFLTPYSRAELNRCLAVMRDGRMQEIERARAFFVVARQCRGGTNSSGWRQTSQSSRRGLAQSVSSWLNAVDLLPELIERLKRVQIECSDFRKIFDLYDSPEALLYLDPPYVHSTRRSGGYAHEMTDDDHHELVERLLAMKGKAILSGYQNKIYTRLEKRGWKREDITTTSFISTLRDTRVESLWLSPNAH